MTKRGTSARKAPLTDQERLREALTPYVQVPQLRYLVARNSESIQKALLLDPPPEEIQMLLKLLAAVLRPLPTEQIRQPMDVVGLMMAEMSHLAQEQLRVICLNSQNHIQAIHTVYQGTVSRASVRLIEVFREAVRYNSPAIILVHNHPSGDPTPSLPDMEMTRRAIQVGGMLGVQVVDHLVIGRGRWVSIAETAPVFAEAIDPATGGPWTPDISLVPFGYE
jgi:hypothetical protein